MLITVYCNKNENDVNDIQTHEFKKDVKTIAVIRQVWSIYFVCHPGKSSMLSDSHFCSHYKGYKTQNHYFNTKRKYLFKFFSILYQFSIMYISRTSSIRLYVYLYYMVFDYIWNYRMQHQDGLLENFIIIQWRLRVMFTPRQCKYKL